jgi:hypothetical protein
VGVVSYADKVWVGMRLARDVDTCHALLAGDAVDESRLDPLGLAWAVQMRFVRLDVSGIELFFGELREFKDAA